ncbi:MAG TPA: FkbM family methyltransferase [Opitutaceae bacterium]|nr:FkbM family methyltransferase [Opitutaceae bacterium]
MKKHLQRARLVMRIRPAIAAALVKRLLGVRRREADTVAGRFWVDPASYLGLTLLEHGAYEPEMMATVERYLQPGDTFVDLGANEGYFTVAGARRVGTAGRVLAIEPQRRLQEVLRRNLALNGCSDRVALAAVAISDRAGEASLHLTPGVNNSASSLSRPTRYPLARQRVACDTLERTLAAHGIAECALLKIDVEGWEYEAVLGSPEFFRQRRARAVALELHPAVLARRGLDGEKITRFLGECGYVAADAPTLVYVRT